MLVWKFKLTIFFITRWVLYLPSLYNIMSIGSNLPASMHCNWKNNNSLFDNLTSFNLVYCRKLMFDEDGRVIGWRSMRLVDGNGWRFNLVYMIILKTMTTWIFNLWRWWSYHVWYKIYSVSPQPIIKSSTILEYFIKHSQWFYRIIV